MDWLKLIDAVLLCTTILLTVGIASFTVLAGLVFDKGTTNPEALSKFLSVVKGVFRPRPRD